MSDHCPVFSSHDWIVTNMQPGKNLMAYYTIECSRCGKRDEGYASEIPTARFP